jgi:hypothetical protein
MVRIPRQQQNEINGTVREALNPGFISILISWFTDN